MGGVVEDNEHFIEKMVVDESARVAPITTSPLLDFKIIPSNCAHGMVHISAQPCSLDFITSRNRSVAVMTCRASPVWT